MSRGVWFILLIQLILVVQLNGIQLEIQCDTNDVHIFYSRDGIKWENTHHGRALQLKNEVGEGQLKDTIQIEVAPASKLRFFIPIRHPKPLLINRVKCVVNDGNTWSPSNEDNSHDGLWIKKEKSVGVIKFFQPPNSNFDVFDFICMYDENYYNPGPIYFKNGRDDLQLQDEPVKHIDEYMKGPENIYPLGGIKYVSKDYTDSNEYDIIRIEMKVKLDNFQRHLDEVNIFGISSKHRDIKPKECWPCIAVDYHGSERNQYRINVHFGSIIVGRIIELGKKMDIAINIHTKINIITVEFDGDMQNPKLYKYKEAEQFLNKNLIIWIGEKINQKVPWMGSIYKFVFAVGKPPECEGSITELKIQNIKQKQLPYIGIYKKQDVSIEKINNVREMHTQTEVKKYKENKIQTIFHGISDTNRETQTEIDSQDDPYIQTSNEKHDINQDVQTLQTGLKKFKDKKKKKKLKEYQTTYDQNDANKRITKTQSISNESTDEFDEKDADTDDEVISDYAENDSSEDDAMSSQEMETQSSSIDDDNQKSQINVDDSQSDWNKKDIKTSNNEDKNKHDMNSSKQKHESESKQNNDSNKDSNTKLHVIIISSTVGIVVLLFVIFIVMTCRRNKLSKNMLSKTQGKTATTKKIDSSLENNIIPDIAVIKNPGSKIPPPPPIYMNDYIDSPRIKQFYKTPKYKQESHIKLNQEIKIPPPPPINMDNYNTTQQNGEHTTYS